MCRLEIGDWEDKNKNKKRSPAHPKFEKLEIGDWRLGLIKNGVPSPAHPKLILLFTRTRRSPPWPLSVGVRRVLQSSKTIDFRSASQGVSKSLLEGFGSRKKTIGNFQEASGGFLGRDFTPPGGPGGRFGLHFGSPWGSCWLSFWRPVLKQLKFHQRVTI